MYGMRNYRSFADATAADLQLKVGIASGPITSGIIGAKKWHYEVIGPAVDMARELESHCPLGSVLLTEETGRCAAGEFAIEQCGPGYRLLHPLITASVVSTTLPPSLLFPSNQRRFSLVTLPQAVHRLLQANAMGEATSEVLLSKSPSDLFHKRGVARGKKSIDFLSADELPVEVEMEGGDGLLSFCALSFHDAKLEQLYHSQLDRWFIPALAISILFLVLYGLYQVLVMPLLLTNLVLIIASLGIMFAGMLVSQSETSPWSSLLVV